MNQGRRGSGTRPWGGRPRGEPTRSCGSTPFGTHASQCSGTRRRRTPSCSTPSEPTSGVRPPSSSFFLFWPSQRCASSLDFYFFHGPLAFGSLGVSRRLLATLEHDCAAPGALKLRRAVSEFKAEVDKFTAGGATTGEEDQGETKKARTTEN